MLQGRPGSIFGAILGAKWEAKEAQGRPGSISGAILGAKWEAKGDQMPPKIDQKINEISNRFFEKNQCDFRWLFLQKGAQARAGVRGPPRPGSEFLQGGARACVNLRTCRKTRFLPRKRQAVTRRRCPKRIYQAHSVTPMPPRKRCLVKKKNVSARLTQEKGGGGVSP